MYLLFQLLELLHRPATRVRVRRQAASVPALLQQPERAQQDRGHRSLQGLWYAPMLEARRRTAITVCCLDPERAG